MKLRHALIALAVGTAATAFAREAAPLTTVGSVDAARYAGRWYEIANYPNRFQRMCAGNTTAEYTLRDDGTLKVINRCSTATGVSEVEGVARRVGDVTDKLEVSFLPAFLRWLPIGWGNYWVIGLAPDYRYAVVGEPSREYLWILSRTPALAEQDRKAIDELLRTQGYEPAKLVATPQGAR
jgi:apolipoprotein D and lipocalin family protein